MADGPENILQAIKTPLGLLSDYTPFDAEILMHINSATSQLGQLNVSPDAIRIDSETTWTDYLGDDQFNVRGMVETYIYLSVKMLFDLSSMAAHHVNANEQILDELKWRIKVGSNPPQDHMPPKSTSGATDDEMGE